VIHILKCLANYIEHEIVLTSPISQIKASAVTISNFKQVSSVKLTAAVSSPPPGIFFLTPICRVPSSGVLIGGHVGHYAALSAAEHHVECSVVESSYDCWYSFDIYRVLEMRPCPVRNRLSIVLSSTLHGRAV